MSGRHHVLLAALIVVVGVLAAAGFARGGTEGRSAGGCRDWVAVRTYAKEIAAARPLVQKMKRAFAAPGLSVAVGANGQLVWSESCGFADRERRRAVRRETTFRIGSVSKALTATAAGLLARQERLELDAEIQRYVPDFPRKQRQITPRQLGGHLAGIRHYEGREALSRTHYDSVRASLAIFKEDPLVTAPGERFFYSSYGFNLLGAAVEGAAGKPFGAAVEHTLLTPLRMRATRLDDGRARAGRSRFYEVTSSRRAVPAPRVDLSNRFPSGGFLSTAEDLVRFGLGVTDRTFAGEETQALLFTSQKTSGGRSTHYGFGFEVGASPFGPVAGHTGNVVGGTAFLLVHPKTRVVVALTTNIGFVTAPVAPALGRGVPDPPAIAVPFIRRTLKAR
ncbi:MAG: serine hydrolase domain-containing protein [Gaiellaceae bacterium]